MTTTFLRALFALLVIASAALAADIGELSRRYARDDKMLGSALRYERTKDGVREQLWITELGDILKVSRETADTLDEISLSDDDVYFAFRKKTVTQPGGSVLVTEERTYFEGYNTVQKTRRTATFTAGAVVAIPASAPSAKLDISKLSEDERRSAPQFREYEEIVKNVRLPANLAHDPAKDAPAEWHRVKLVRKSASPDGRYAIALAPDKADFQWDDYFDADLNSYMADDEPVSNFIVDVKNHRIVGKTLCHHFGTRERYNHRENTMAWSPDGGTFVQITSGKWSYDDCCIGHITDGKLDAAEDLGSIVSERAKKFLIAEKNPEYRRHAKDMEAAIFEPNLKGDGTGTIDVVFQYPKLAYTPTVRVRFRLTAGKNPPRVEILGAAYAPEPR